MFLVAVVYVVWCAGKSAEGGMDVWVEIGLCTMPGYRMILLICSSEDRRCCGVLGGMCCCLCCSRNPKLGLFAPGLQDYRAQS